MKQLQDFQDKILQAVRRSRVQLYPRAIDIIKPYLSWLGLGIVGVVAIAVYLTQPATNQPQVKGISISSATSAAAISSIKDDLKVDVSGAVNRPGVKVLKAGDRVEDAIRAADGLSDKADTVYVAMSINLAAKVQDGDKIFVPAIDQASQAAPSTASITTPPTAKSSSTKPNNGKVSLNQATANQLDTLPGIGETYAARIIAGRPYSSIDDLCSRNIFRSKNTCNDIRSLVSL